jgi:dTDP-4-amino-4,6-dideoxygalactose transaminase
VNSRLDELQAAVLRARLPGLSRRTTARRALAAEYRAGLASSNRVTVPPEIDPGHVYHLFPVRTARRAELQDRLRSSGIETLVHYPVAINRQPAFVPARGADCRRALAAASEVLSLPLYPSLSAESVRVVTDAIRKDVS